MSHRFDRTQALNVSSSEDARYWVIDAYLRSICKMARNSSCNIMTSILCLIKYLLEGENTCWNRVYIPGRARRTESVGATSQPWQ